MASLLELEGGLFLCAGSDTPQIISNYSPLLSPYFTFGTLLACNELSQ
jgi:hypothetical protein